MNLCKSPTDFDRTSCIYSINCNQCNGKYIGQTQNKLKTRISGHQTNMNTLNKLLNTGHIITDQEVLKVRAQTALVDHAAVNSHDFDLKGARILDTTYKTSNLNILESCHIFNTDNTVNVREDTDNLHAAYGGFLHALKVQYKYKETPKTQNQNCHTHSQTLNSL